MCIISSYVNSKWSYSPETVKLGFDLCDHDSLEQYGRRNNLRISGVPEPKLEPEEVEDTTATIVDLANSALKLDPPLQVSDVEVSHRLKKPRNAKDGDPRPIIVRFGSKYDTRTIPRDIQSKAYERL